VVRDDNTRAMRLMAGAADLAYDALPPLLVPLFEDDPRFEVRTAPGVSTTYLGLNMEAPPLDDPRVREAIARAIDRATLVRAELEGSAPRSRPPGSRPATGPTPSSSRAPSIRSGPARSSRRRGPRAAGSCSG